MYMVYSINNSKRTIPKLSKSYFKVTQLCISIQYPKDKRGESIDTIPIEGICTLVLDKSVSFNKARFHS